MPVVLGASLLAVRLFDIAYAIDLPAAEKLWARAGRGGKRSRLQATPPKAVDFGVPPLELTLDPVTIGIGAAPVDVAVSARLYDFGVIVLTLRVPADGLGWDAYVGRMTALDLAVGAAASRAGTAPWAPLLARLRTMLGAAFVRPSAATIEEDYLVGVVQGFSPPVAAARLAETIDLVPLLSGETRPLSDGARADLLRHRYAYYADDLTVLTWDRAFLLEPRGETDVLDVLEVANAQLLEMRYYDELLDAELPRMYDLIENARRARAVFAARRFADLARRVHTLVAEVTELAERVDNALQVTEDVYLARIYAAALDLFRVPAVSAAVNRKLAILRDTYAALHDEAQSGRAELLEVLIVLLILCEIALALWRG
jgi:hypothetical protein